MKEPFKMVEKIFFADIKADTGNVFPKELLEKIVYASNYLNCFQVPIMVVNDPGYARTKGIFKKYNGLRIDEMKDLFVGRLERLFMEDGIVYASMFLESDRIDNSFDSKIIRPFGLAQNDAIGNITVFHLLLLNFVDKSEDSYATYRNLDF